MLIEVSLKVMPPRCGGVGAGRGKPIAPADGRCRLSIRINA